MITYVVAIAENGAIGKDNKLIWHLPADLKFFKQLTLGHTIAMGRKTFESIGKPLPGRKTVIITRDKTYSYEGTTVFNSIQDFENYAKGDEEVFVIGGAEIFSELMSVADKMVITRVHATFDADVFFPEVNWNEWKLVKSEPHKKDEKNPYDYTFEFYERRM